MWHAYRVKYSAPNYPNPTRLSPHRVDRDLPTRISFLITSIQARNASTTEPSWLKHIC